MRPLRASGGLLGPLRGVLEGFRPKRSGEPLGAILEPLGRVLGPLGAVLVSPTLPPALEELSRTWAHFFFP